MHTYILHKHIPIKFKNVLLEIPRISLPNFQKSRRTNLSLKNESTPSIFQFLIILKILWTHWKPLTPTKRPLIETIFLLAWTVSNQFSRLKFSRAVKQLTRSAILTGEKSRDIGALLTRIGGTTDIENSHAGAPVKMLSCNERPWIRGNSGGGLYWSYLARPQRSHVSTSFLQFLASSKWMIN